MEHNGNRIDIGGHRFFSKDPAVMKWWTDLLPIQGKPAADDLPGPHAKAFPADGPDPEREDRVMLLRHRLSHILYNRKFFTYPVTFNMETLLNLGLFRSAYAGAGWMYANMFKRAETSLEDFYINRFGTPLYNMFFKHYTEKVWGLPPSKLDASWGRQRVNGISISTLLKNFTRQKAHPRNDIRQEGVEKSLISNFLYPKLGPGQLWEEAAREIILGHRACRLNLQDGKVREITATTTTSGWGWNISATKETPYGGFPTRISSRWHSKNCGGPAFRAAWRTWRTPPSSGSGKPIPPTMAAMQNCRK